MPVLRLATEDDFQVINSLGKAFVSEFSLPYAFNEETFKTNYTRLIQNPDCLILLLDNVGMLMAYADKPIFSDDKIAAELAWYILPKERKGKGGLMLLAAFEYWAKKIGCKAIQMNHLNNDKIGRLYERRGYKKTEEIYLKWL